MISAGSRGVFAQNAEFIWSPEFAYSWKQSDRLSFTTKLSVFNVPDQYPGDKFLQYVEPQFSFAFSLSPRIKLGMGYYYRRSEPLVTADRYEHRLLQQAGFISFIGDERLSHRIRTEQRFRSSSFQNRLRYRLAYDFPLSGEQLDEGERYGILKNEIMTAFTLDEADAENRFSVGMGWYYSRKFKFELGLEYRTQDIFSDSGIGHLFLLSTAFYFNR